MPLLIENIDAIARKQQRAVLFVEFHPHFSSDDSDPEEYGEYDYQQDARRQALLDWLAQHAIAWRPCFPIASECGFESYRGQIYIDLAMDEADPQYCLLRDHLEYPDGSMRDSNVTFCYLPLETAMQNAHHDEPGFWERWAEDF